VRAACHSGHVAVHAWLPRLKLATIVYIYIYMFDRVKKTVGYRLYSARYNLYALYITVMFVFICGVTLASPFLADRAHRRRKGLKSV